MDITILVSKVFGVYLIVAGLFILFKGKTIPHLLKDFYDHPAICYLTGIILIFLSTIYLLQYNIWNGSWQTIITIFVWMIMLKGLAYVFVPKSLEILNKKKIHGPLSVYGVIALIIGAYLLLILV